MLPCWLEVKKKASSPPPLVLAVLLSRPLGRKRVKRMRKRARGEAGKATWHGIESIRKDAP
jgi:hypothetical protein